MSISFFSTFCVLSLYPYFLSGTDLRIRVCKREELEAHFSVHHLALFFKPRQWMVMCSFLVPVLLNPLFSRIRISVDKRVEHEAHLSVHHLALFFNQGGGCSCVPFMVPCLWHPLF